jgi:hypothetical protein
MFGLGFGGCTWLFATSLILPTSDADALMWLRHHVWDYLAAGALAAIFWYLLISKQAKLRLAVSMLVNYAIGAITTFTADDSSAILIGSVTFFCGTLVTFAGIPLCKIIDEDFDFSIKSILVKR